MKKSNILGILLVIIVLVGAAALFTSSRSSQETGGVDVGVIIGLTGPTAESSERVVNGFGILQDMYREEHGLEIAFDVMDDSYDPKKTVSAYNALKLKGVQYYLSSGSGPGLAIADIVSQDGNIMMGGGTASAYGETDAHNLRVVMSSDQEGEIIAALIEQAGIEKLAILVHPSDYGVSYMNAIQETFAGEVVFAEQLNTSSDYATQLTKVSESGADGLFFIDLGAGSIKLLNKRYLLPDEIKIFSHQWAMSPEVIAETAENAEGVLFSAIDIQDSEFSETFNQRYQERYGKMPSFDVYTYAEGANVLFEALLHTDKTPEQVKEYLLSNAFVGFSGAIAFDERGNRVETRLATYEVQNGVPVKAADLGE
jgi:ABC-type branched-subunit amino acid transport system substrate-binding protein